MAMNQENIEELRQACAEFRRRFGRYLVGQWHDGNDVSACLLNLGQVIAAIKVRKNLRSELSKEPDLAILLDYSKPGASERQR